MAKPYLIIIFSILLVIDSSYNFVAAQTSKKTKSGTLQSTKRPIRRKAASIKDLTEQDRKNYLLTIDQSKIGKPHDTILYKEKFKAFNVPVRLSNLSNDTLRYLSMTCSWEIFFSINNKKLSFLLWVCDSNIPIDKLVLPHKSVTYNMPLVLMNGYVRRNKFKIGMNLFVTNNDRSIIFGFPWPGYETKNVIWSNEVTVP